MEVLNGNRHLNKLYPWRVPTLGSYAYASLKANPMVVFQALNISKSFLHIKCAYTTGTSLISNSGRRWLNESRDVVLRLLPRSSLTSQHSHKMHNYDCLVPFILSKLEPHKSLGSGEFCSHLLRFLVSAILHPLLARLFNLSILTKILPNDWSGVVVTHISKKGSDRHRKSFPDRFNYNRRCWRLPHRLIFHVHNDL